MAKRVIQSAVILDVKQTLPELMPDTIQLYMKSSMDALKSTTDNPINWEDLHVTIGPRPEQGQLAFVFTVTSEES